VKYIIGFVKFWYDFIVGDDWRLAIGAGIGLGLSALAVHAHIPAWWVLPLTTLVILVGSLLHATRRT
jgi:hypothetical protein